MPCSNNKNTKLCFCVCQGTPIRKVCTLRKVFNAADDISKMHIITGRAPVTSWVHFSQSG